MSKQLTITQKKKDIAKKKAIVKKKKKAAWNKKLIIQRKIAVKKKQLVKAKLKIKEAEKKKKARLAKTKKSIMKMKVGKANVITQPKVIQKVKVADLLTRKDEKHMQENSISLVSVQIDGKKFGLSKIASVPKNAKILRDSQGQVTGMRAIASG